MHARARTAGRKAERSGQAAYPPTTWHTVTRLQSIKCVRLLWLMHYGAIKNGKYSERRAACARPATGPHSMSDEYVRAARSIAFKYNARRYRLRHARTTIRPRKRRRDEHHLRASSNFCLLFLHPPPPTFLWEGVGKLVLLLARRMIPNGDYYYSLSF